jgi:hypothetical protein
MAVVRRSGAGGQVVGLGGEIVKRLIYTVIIQNRIGKKP